MATRIPWRETDVGWCADMGCGIVLSVKRAHRGGGYAWSLDAFSADDDTRGIQPTDASAKHVAEKAYRAWRERQVI